MTTLIVIPARWRSSRFPGKPLAELGGKTVLERVFDQCCKAVDPEYIRIATDEQRIADVAEAFGAYVTMTSPDCLTGTDRVAEVASGIGADWYVNVQGDEPFVLPESILAVIKRAESADGSVAAINAMSPIESESGFRSSTVPKVVCDLNQRLLYISRGAIPTGKDLAFSSAFRQVGLYAFRPEALSAFAAQGEKTPLEAVEDIEILRLLELGFTVEMVEVGEGGLAIDTPEDLERARALIGAGPGPVED